MAQTYLILALIIQCSFVFATQIDVSEDPIPSREELLKPDVDEKDQEGHEHWMDMFSKGENNFYPSSSAAMMAQVTNSSNNKTVEDQLREIKDMAYKITMAIQSEMANLLTYALNTCEKDKDEKGELKTENHLRRKRETPMDSTQMVMRLLKHIKSNNEYQNIAIEKMMSAQEIADKYGIAFNPDPNILTDFAVAASEQAKDLTSMLTETCDGKNTTLKQVEFVPLEKESSGKIAEDTYYVYAVNHPEEMYTHLPPYEYMPELTHPPKHEHIHYSPQYETQVRPHHYPPTTPKPTFYDSFMPEHYQAYCPMEPVTTISSIVVPFEEVIEPEPELVGEEYEETVSSKVTIDHDEPGCSTVNHVMTYTLSEKTHFKTPQIEQLPQQMQYTFFLM
ncbi:uncharacterized protein LOC113240131 [Hyposmocoma kahamanoa]|uniref:uncharacterized protein LOC113240131 n=1 Tax=Hyposmocoma kahamanoa TaxID=1477025 RepID=UPI000E6D863D|nr:uncharacterized protein LOC113240131 [Hyposmocoma kahamanoa]